MIIFFCITCNIHSFWLKELAERCYFCVWSDAALGNSFKNDRERGNYRWYPIITLLPPSLSIPKCAHTYHGPDRSAHHGGQKGAWWDSEIYFLTTGSRWRPILTTLQIQMETRKGVPSGVPVIKSDSWDTSLAAKLLWCICLSLKLRDLKVNVK